jgi:hypothetical protein
MKGLIAVLMLVLAVMVCVPQTAEAGIFGSRSRQVVVQKQVRQKVVVQQQVVRQRVVQQQVVVPYVQQVQVQQVYVPQQFRQQFNGGHCNGVDNTGVLQLNNGCSALYGR